MVYFCLVQFYCDYPCCLSGFINQPLFRLWGVYALAAMFLD